MADHPRRQSIFHEVGLRDPDSTPARSATSRDRPQSVRFRSRDEVHVVERYHDADVNISEKSRPRVVNFESPTPIATPAQATQARSRSMMYRIGASLLVLAAAVPLITFSHGAAVPLQPVEGNPIPKGDASRTGPDLAKRSDSPTDVCFRWAQQSAIVNGTLYLYGGQASTEPGQVANTWNNDFLTLDLTKTWQIASPSLTGLPQPSGPPPVALGTLWNSPDSLYLYGGEFSSNPTTTPVPFALWEYNIPSQSWIEHSNPTTSSGNNAPDNEVPVQRAAEGAGCSVPSLGRGYYFGGHLDPYTTPGWLQWTYREYLQSLLEFTFPGYPNSQVSALSSGQDAGSDGNYRNITVGGLQQDAGFTARADGLLIYVPGFGEQGILLALAGGTNVTFTQMNEVNIYDIANSTWYTQSTSGETPNIRVNPCGVAVSAPDGSSTNIYMYGGQSLQPANNQTEYDDMWILTLPSFTWIQVNQTGQSIPYGRSGHTCNAWDGQMVMVGGYVGAQLSCESPGIYVFDMSNLQWVQQFTALSPGTDDTSSDPQGTGSSGGSSKSSSSDFNSTGSNNPLNQQPAQIANSSNPGGLQGSYGYTVPQVVIDVIGGSPSGGATVTKPVVTATGGPLATGSPITYTVTQSNGATITETAAPGSTIVTDNRKRGPNIAAIVVGVVCGLLFIVVCYLAFCAYIYRKQLQLYKQHVEMSQRQARGEKLPAIPGLLASDSAKTSSERPARTGLTPYETSSQTGSHAASSAAAQSAAQTSNNSSGRTAGYQSLRRDSDTSSTEDLLAGNQPTFVGVMLNPRRSLKVVNRD